jgi:hypothetical protein
VRRADLTVFKKYCNKCVKGMNMTDLSLSVSEVMYIRGDAEQI